MLGGGGRLFKLKDNLVMAMGDFILVGIIVLRFGVSMVGGIGRFGDFIFCDKFVGVWVFLFECLIIGVIVIGCGGRFFGVEVLLFGVFVFLMVSRSFIMGVVVCGGFGVV